MNIKTLEEWSHKHKARAVQLGIDNGYGASSWEIILWHEEGTLKVVESVGEILLYQTKEQKHMNDLDLFGNEYVHIKVASKENDWIGLELLVKTALDYAP